MIATPFRDLFIEVPRDNAEPIEEQIVNHYESYMLAGMTPPKAYRLSPARFDDMAERTNAKVEFGTRKPDLSRDEWVQLICSYGLLRVYLARGGVADDEIGIMEHTEL